MRQRKSLKGQQKWQPGFQFTEVETGTAFSAWLPTHKNIPKHLLNIGSNPKYQEQKCNPNEGRRAASTSRRQAACRWDTDSKMPMVQFWKAAEEET